MNRRIRNPTQPDKYHRFLKPGALARIRDTKMVARSPPPAGPATPTKKIRLPFAASPPPPPPSDGSPRLSPRVYGPRSLNRKKMLASKRIFFAPSSPVSDNSDSGLDPFGLSDLLVAH